MDHLKSPSLASCLKTSDAIGLIANLLMIVLSKKNPKINNGLSYPTLICDRTKLILQYTPLLFLTFWWSGKYNK